MGVPHGTVRVKLVNDRQVWTHVAKAEGIQQIGLWQSSRSSSSRPGYTSVATSKTLIPLTCISVTERAVFAGDLRGHPQVWPLVDDSVLAHDLNAFHTRGGTHSKAIACCQIMEPLDLFATSSLDKTTRLWDTRTGSSITCIPHGAHMETIRMDQFDLFMGSFAGDVVQYDIRQLDNPVFRCQLNQRIMQMYFDVHKLVVSANQHVVIWDRKDLSRHRVALRAPHRIQGLQVYEEKLITADDSGAVQVWSPKCLPHASPALSESTLMPSRSCTLQ